jgi:hypothetical protein
MTWPYFLYCLRRPGYAVRRLYLRTSDFLHRHEPWISHEAVVYCAGYLSSSQVGLEWGSGRSTRWYGERLGKLLSVEFDPVWYRRVLRATRHLPNVECRFIALDHSPSEPTVRDYNPVPAYVAVAEEFADGSLDFVVVDGHYRLACIKQVLPKIKPGGLLLVDNTDWLPLLDWGVPASWPIVHQSQSLTQTTIWLKPRKPVAASAVSS